MPSCGSTAGIERQPNGRSKGATRGDTLIKCRRFGRTGWTVNEIGYGMWGQVIIIAEGEPVHE